jgi:ankyrin repeat protein
MIPQEHIRKIIDNLGKNGDKAWFYINDYQHEIANAKDEQGFSLLAHAIKSNDGGNISYLLRLGADMNAPTKEGGKMSSYEYAKQYATYGGRKPFAFEAFESFKTIKDNLKVQILPDHAVDTDNKTKQAWFENAKNKNDDELVSLYHGAKTYTVDTGTVESIKSGFLKTNCIQEASGPTLSIKPLGQFWMGLGFEVQIPRSKIEFPGESKENPLIKVSEDGVAFILNETKSIKFDEYRSKILLNLRCCSSETDVEPTYGVGENTKPSNYAGKFTLDEKTIQSLNEVQEIMELNLAKVMQKEKSLSNIERFRQSREQPKISNTLKYG